jgi:hypothetical protein
MVSENQLAGIAIGIGFAIEKKSFSNLEDPDGISITIPNAISIAIRCGYSFTYIALMPFTGGGMSALQAST